MYCSCAIETPVLFSTILISHATNVFFLDLKMLPLHQNPAKSLLIEGATLTFTH